MIPSNVIIEPVIFTESKTKVPGVRVEYYIYESGVKFHIWADPEFPDCIDSCIKEEWSKFPEKSVIAEYVPEVDSWYGELKNITVGISDVLAESLIAKVDKEVSKHG